ncbi:hypothetical protein B0H14DRAFT_2571923 [Mycena olivaceomarginata]|nr:hypothetical protein B0H14DRAFT_2571923 [Mycena olivaceomarginata]
MSALQSAAPVRTSPVHSNRATRKNKRVIHATNHTDRVNALRARIQALKNPVQVARKPVEPPSYLDDAMDSVDDMDQDWVDEDSDMPPLPPSSCLPPILVSIPGSDTRSAAQRLCAAWDLLLANLQEPFTEYMYASYAQRPSIISSMIRHGCTASCDTPIVATIQCLYISHFEEVHVETCSCVPVAVLLVRSVGSCWVPESWVSILWLEQMLGHPIHTSAGSEYLSWWIPCTYKFISDRHQYSKQA